MQRLYTATAHGLHAATAPESYEDARGFAEQLARLFGRSEIVVVERGNQWHSHGGPDRRYRERAPTVGERPVMRLVATVFPGGTMQMSLRLRVQLHAGEGASRPLPPLPTAEEGRQVPLFGVSDGVSQEG